MNGCLCIPVKLYKNRQWAAKFSEVGLMCLGVYFFRFILFGYILLEFVDLHILPNLGRFSQCFFEYFFSPISPFWDSKDMNTRSFAKVLLVSDTGLIFFHLFSPFKSGNLLFKSTSSFLRPLLSVVVEVPPSPLYASVIFLSGSSCVLFAETAYFSICFRCVHNCLLQHFYDCFTSIVR